MNVDIITIWPRNHDYPPFRKLLKNLEPFYNRAIIGLNGEGAPYDYGNFLANVMNPKKTIFVNSRMHEGSEDWRNVAIHACLGNSTSEWIWFLEPDFFIEGDGFVRTIFEAGNHFDAVGFWEANRLHPACLLIKRSLLDKTRKDFSVVPGKLDHFGQFSQDVVKELGMDGIGELEKIGLNNGEHWYHMQGVTHNINLCRANDRGKIYKENEFATYCIESQFCGVPISRDYEEEMQKITAPHEIGGDWWDTKISRFLNSLR